MNNIKEYISIANLPEHTNGLFNSQSVQWLIRNRFHNGLHPYCKKVNGRLFINTRGFENWFEEHSA